MRRTNDLSSGPAPVIPDEFESLLKSYVVCQQPSGHSLLFHRIILPNDLPEKFLNLLGSSHDRFSVLYGKLVSYF